MQMTQKLTVVSQRIVSIIIVVATSRIFNWNLMTRHQLTTIEFNILSQTDHQPLASPQK